MRIRIPQKWKHNFLLIVLTSFLILLLFSFQKVQAQHHHPHLQSSPNDRSNDNEDRKESRDEDVRIGKRTATITAQESEAKHELSLRNIENRRSMEEYPNDSEKQIQETHAVRQQQQKPWRRWVQKRFYSVHNHHDDNRLWWWWWKRKTPFSSWSQTISKFHFHRQGNNPSRDNVMAYLENDDRRVRAFSWPSCPSSTRTDVAHNYNVFDDLDALSSSSNSIMSCDATTDKRSDRRGIEDCTDSSMIFQGTILQVASDSDKRYLESDLDTDGDMAVDDRFQENQIILGEDMDTSSSRSGPMSSRNEVYAIDTYQLLEPIHLELGVSSKHTIDFAYTPVNILDGSMTVREQNEQYSQHYYSNSKTAVLVVNDEPAIPKSRSWWEWWFPMATRKQFWKGRHENFFENEYEMSDTAFAGGSHGEVWRGRRLCKNNFPNKQQQENQYLFEKMDTQEEKLIFKRLKVEHGYRLLEAGLREVYIGKLLAEDPSADGLFTTYVDHFFREVPKPSRAEISLKDKESRIENESDLELWIVFKDAGPSMRSYLYSPTSTGEFVVYQHSYLWTKFRQNAFNNAKVENQNDKSLSTLLTTSQKKSEMNQQSGSAINGKSIMREVLRQVLSSAAFLHEHGVIHRDIKPSNFMCATNVDAETLQILVSGELTTISDNLKIHCVLGDFSSIYDNYTSTNLYTKGPSLEELTIEYAPPETLLGSPWKSFSEEKPESYDSWSIGVLALELLLGTPNVFSVDQRTTALLTNKMQHKGASEKEIRQALYLASLSQFCIFMPASQAKPKGSRLSWPLRKGDPLYKIAMVKESCTLEDFHQALRARDPLGLGFDESTDQLLHLIWQLLAWDPLERISAAEALQHPYFTLDIVETSQSHHNNDQTALESQMLDPRMDFNVSDTVDSFTCPTCGRIFHDWQSCHHHTNARKHAKFCSYDHSKLPSSVNAHSMLPAHKNSGYYDIQGRRPTIEDFHSIRLTVDAQFYGVFDGHSGNLASKYAASTFFEQLHKSLKNVDNEVRDDPHGWKESVHNNVTQVFSSIHNQFLIAASQSGHTEDASGTTATVVYVTEEAVVVASIGDSRAILSNVSHSTSSLQKENHKARSKKNGMTFPLEMSAIQLSKDHVASDVHEATLVQGRGGSIKIVNGLARVNGSLAITRSIGDAPLAGVLSRAPHVVSMTRKELMTTCNALVGENFTEKSSCFIVLASDGLWDLVTNQEAVDMVAQTIAMHNYNSTKESGTAFQEASKLLTLEAYVRGSRDNIGVCVISLL